MLCSNCKLNLTNDKFSKRSNGTCVSKCKECQNKYSKEHYKLNKHKHNTARYARRKLERQLIRELIKQTKNKPCMDCGEQHPYWAMDFDHRNPKLKKFNLANAVNTGSIKKVQTEIDKCDVVCALCHRYRTYNK